MMNLTSAQKTALAGHINLNTNSAPIPGGAGTFVINAAVAGRDPTLQIGIANWYNQTALAGDNQPFTNLQVWNAFTTLVQLNAVMKFTMATVDEGATPTDAQITNFLLMWQIMIWDLGPTSGGMDMGDPQVRQGIMNIWGDTTTAPANAKQIFAPGCGQQVGRNIELILSNVVTTVSAGGSAQPAHPIQKDAAGATIYGQQITALNIDNALFPNG